MVKILLVGESGVGKTSLLFKYANNEFSEGITQSAGLAQEQKILNINNTEISLSIWDIAGTEKYKSMAQLFFKDGQGALLVYDKTKSDTFFSLPFWVNELQLHTGPNKPIVIVANKADKTEEFQVTTDQGLDYANSNQCKFFEVSAKTGEGINEAFNALASQLINDPNMISLNKSTLSNSNTKHKKIKCSC